MTREELMKPRFEIIADYPGNRYGNIGDIINGNRSGIVDEWEHSQKNWSLSDFPHLFRKLNWWEHRTAEEMPSKVVSKAIPGDDEVYTIIEWDMEQLIGWIDKEKKEVASLTTFVPEYGYFPID